MKYVLLMSVLFSISAVAHEDIVEKLVCQEYKGKKILERTVVLRPIGKAQNWSDEEGVHFGYKIPYSIAIYSGLGNGPFEDIYAKGMVYTADVHYEFKSEDGNINFTTYLDELEESTLTETVDGGVKVSSFVCR